MSKESLLVNAGSILVRASAKMRVFYRRKLSITITPQDTFSNALPKPLEDTAINFNGNFSILALMSLVLGLFWMLKSNFSIDQGAEPGNFFAILVVSLLGSLWSSRDLPMFFNVVALALNACCVAYLVGSRHTYDLGFENDIINSAWLPITLGMIAFLRPSLAIWPAVAMHWSKHHILVATGWGSYGGADYIIIPDLAMLISLILAVLTVSMGTLRALKLAGSDSRALVEQYCTGGIMILAAVHLSNYFYSGIGKLFLQNGNIFTWVLENKTYFLAIHATDIGFITIPTILSGIGINLDITNYIVFLNVPINILVLAGQILSVICLLSMKKAAKLTAFFDLMHVGIFLLSGIFFWKWIALNAAFIFSFTQLSRRKNVNFSSRLYGCALVIAAPLMFHVVKLAWYDTGAVNEPVFQAITADNQAFTAPSNFFLDSSIDVAQQRFSHPSTGYLPTGTWGTTGDADVMRRVAANCQGEVAPFVLKDADRTKIAVLVQRQQKLALGLADNGGHIAYDRYPHHIWSAPWQFSQFANLDVRKIKGYRLIIQSFCVSVTSDGHIQRVPVGKVTYEFSL